MRKSVTTSAAMAVCSAMIFTGALAGCSTSASQQSDQAMQGRPRTATAQQNDSIAANLFEPSCGIATYVVLNIRNNTGADIHADGQSAYDMPFNYAATIPSGQSGTINACGGFGDPDNDDNLVSSAKLNIQYVDSKGNAYNIILKETAVNDTYASMSAWWAYNKNPNPDSDTPADTSSTFAADTAGFTGNTLNITLPPQPTAPPLVPGLGAK